MKTQTAPSADVLAARSSRRAPLQPVPAPTAAGLSASNPALRSFVAQVAAAGGDVQVDVGGCARPARPAASCLLTPEVGDTVACLMAGDVVWISAVLERAAATQPATLAFNQGVRLQAPQGSIELQAKHLNLKVDQLTGQADQAVFSVEQADLMAQRLNLVARTLKVVGGLWSSVFDRVQHFSQQYQRTTEGLDRVEAAQVQCEAAQLLQLHGQHTLINGEKLVKARGAQIHFG